MYAACFLAICMLLLTPITIFEINTLVKCNCENRVSNKLYKPKFRLYIQISSSHQLWFQSTMRQFVSEWLHDSKTLQNESVENFSDLVTRLVNSWILFGIISQISFTFTVEWSWLNHQYIRGARMNDPDQLNDLGKMSGHWNTFTYLSSYGPPVLE